MKKFKYLSIPYIIWLFILVVLPLIAMLVLSFMDSDALDLSTAKFSLDNWASLFNGVYLNAFYNSLKIAGIATIVCVLIGYPISYIISNSHLKNKFALIMVLILPMWSNQLLRIIAWEKIFYPISIINNIGLSFDLIGTDFAVIFATVTMYLPFMILPTFTVLEKMDKSYVEASYDLGVSRPRTFFKITLPMSSKGIMSGVIMVFLPASTGFAITERLGGGKIVMIGNIIENFFKRSFNYNMGSMLSLVVIMVIMGAIVLLSKFDKEGETII
ncbi:MAG: ABC transporter permease [Bacilli bacterium]